MTGAQDYDAVVIGAGVNGLAAASYLAMAGKRVLVAEARNAPGGLCATAPFGEGFLHSKIAHALYALDPEVVKDLKLARHGLRFAVRDMALVGLRPEGKHLVLSRDAQATCRRIAAHSEADAAAWPRFRRQWFELARRLRSLWWRLGPDAGEIPAADDEVEALARLGAQAWLDAVFESDALKATLGFDAHALSPLAAGSALLLAWRAAQEMCGLQAAVALPRGGLQCVADALAGAALSLGAELRTGARVTDILADGSVTGIVLESGETVAAPNVLSSLSRRQTLAFPSLNRVLGFAAAAALARPERATAAARVTLALDAAPAIAGTSVPTTGRFVLVDKLESLAAAHAASYAGRLPQELAMEAIMPDAADPALAPEGCHLLSVLVAPVPQDPVGGWRIAKPVLAAKVVQALARHMPELNRHLVAAEVSTPDELAARYGAGDAFGGAVDATRLLAGWRARVATPIPGLVLCGAAADPVGAVSGRGGRAAAALVFEREARRAP